MADTISSYGTTAPKPSGAINSSTVTTSTPSGHTYDVPTGGIWSNPIGNSSWVAVNPSDYPGGGHVEPTGTYSYYTTFLATSSETGFLTVLADDTTNVLLNGVQILSAASFTPSAHCTVGTPNCIMSATVDLSGFVTGTNILTFDVDQLYGSATGLDFNGQIGVTPEPSSLLLMGSGLTAMAGVFSRRRKQA